MKLVRIIIASLTSVIGLGAPSLGATHALTKRTIGRQVVENALPVGNGAKVQKSAWKSLVTKLSSLEIKTQGLKEIKDSTDSEDNKAEKLRKGCSYSYRSIYGSAIKIKDTDLLEDVQNACIRKIGEQLGDKKMNFENPKEEVQKFLQEKLKILKTAKDEDLDISLKKIKDKSAEKDGKYSNSMDLKKGCISSYDRGYQGDNSKKWKLVNTYCIKGEESSKAQE